MSFRSELDAADWRKLQLAPLWTFALVAGADGDVDDDEWAALSDELDEESYRANAFVGELFASVREDWDELLAAAGAAEGTPNDELEAAGDVLTGQLRDDVFKDFAESLVQLAHRVAEASETFFADGESVDEAAAVERVSVALGLT